MAITPNAMRPTREGTKRSQLVSLEMFLRIQTVSKKNIVSSSAGEDRGIWAHRLLLHLNPPPLDSIGEALLQSHSGDESHLIAQSSDMGDHKLRHARACRGCGDWHARA